MSERIAALHQQLDELDTAPILAQAAAAKRAVRSAVTIIAAQENDLAVIRSRLDNVEARAADALGRVVKLEGQNDGA